MRQLVILLVGFLFCGSTVKAAEQGFEFFETNIRPQLVEHCYACHSQNAQAKQSLKGGLRLDSREAIANGGDSGPAIVPGKPDESLLISALRHEGYEMPPSGRLPENVIADFVKWIEMGAPVPESIPPSAASDENQKHWAFQPVVDPTVPKVQDVSWPRDEIDRFVLARLESADLTPAPRTDAHALLRRVSYDVLGLPPTHEQAESFESNHDPAAYARLVDEMLESPHFGVHWARFWLDNVRFAQDDYTCGAFQSNEFDATPYRDWLVRSLNEDLPYDEFVRMQIAGDLIPHEDPTRINADGITATGIWTFPHIVADNDPEKVLVDFVDQQLDVLGRTFLGLTLACARCHDHKFDPISQQDYYGLAGIFLSCHSMSRMNPETGQLSHPRSAFRTLRPTFQTKQERADYEHALTEIERLEAERRKLREQHSAAFDLRRVRERIERLNGRDADSDDEKQRRESYKTQLMEEERQLLEKIDPAFLEEQADSVFARYDALEESVTKLRKPLKKFPLRPAITEGGAPGTRFDGKIMDIPVFLRGQHSSPGATAPRSFPEVLCWQDEPPISSRTDGSGRLELAEWIVDPQHPLTARVMVNRVWQQLLGEGLVRTPSNFGTLGARPTHPRLLDHLAHRFVESGWSIKQLVRDIVLSATYQQDSRVSKESFQSDPENRLLGRMNRKRLTGEQLYDTLQVISGKLLESNEGQRILASGRALYVKVSRVETPPAFSMQFDVPDSSLVVPDRSETVAATQSLYLLNNPAVLEVAADCAQQLQASGSNDRDRVIQAYRDILGRPPTEVETEMAVSLNDQFRSEWQSTTPEQPLSEEEVNSRAWRDLCHVLLCGSEFLYVD